LNARRLRQMKQEYDKEQQKKANEKISDCGAEFGEELHKATKRRVINDGVKDNNF